MAGETPLQLPTKREFSNSEYQEKKSFFGRAKSTYLNILVFIVNIIHKDTLGVENALKKGEFEEYLIAWNSTF